MNMNNRLIKEIHRGGAETRRKPNSKSNPGQLKHCSESFNLGQAVKGDTLSAILGAQGLQGLKPITF